MAELVAIYGRLIGARIRADWQYRTSFVLYALGQTFVAGLDLAALAVIFSQVNALAGWSLGEAALLYGTSGLSFGLADVFVSQVERTSFHIKQGSFDSFLLRPLGPLFQLSTQEFALRRAGRVVQPLVVTVIAIATVPVDWSMLRVAVFAITVISGTVIFSAIWVVTSSIAFWTVETQEVANSFTYGGNFITEYPLDVLRGWLHRLVVIIPVAFVNYLPVAWILHRRTAVGMPAWTGLFAPAVAVASAFVARAVWFTAIRHYRSTGS